ncbi:MAG: ATP-binding cassette domain-containing protein [Chloroflexota bacterium]|nr:ATP-binding cassette domain-containing protein [Chloroflexota bacterium]
MLLVNFSRVSKDYAGNPVFRDLDLDILEGARIGLVGENGSGKSTLFKLLCGLETPTSGQIARKRNLTIGLLQQEVDISEYSKTIFEAVSTASAELPGLAKRLGDLETRMAASEVVADADLLERVLAEYSQVQARYEALGGYTLNYRVEAVLNGLGFASHEHTHLVGSLSGGEKKLVNLAKILLRQPDLLLLDEPDNHLDIEAKAWLEQYIRDYHGTVVIISHDRHLLDRAVTKIIELEDGTLSEYAGSYSFFVEERQLRLERRKETHYLQQEEIKRLKESMHQLKGWARMNSKFAARARNMERRVDKARSEAIARPIMTRDRINVDLDAERSGKKVLEIKGLSKELGGHLLFAPFDLLLMYGERVGIVGPNGSGKTTLLKTMLGLLPPTTGSVKIGASVSVGYYSQEQETLPFEKTPVDYIRDLKKLTEPQAISFLRGLLFTYEDLRTSIARLSGGEKSRLQFARLMLTESNFLLLDEPTNNLDIASIEVLEGALDDFEGTLLTVSHDQYFLNRNVTKILALEPGGRVRVYPGNYADYLEQRAR